MFVDKEFTDPYRGLNPNFVRRVRAKREQERAAEKLRLMEAAAEQLARKKSLPKTAEKKNRNIVRDLRRAGIDIKIEKIRQERENELQRLSRIEPKTAKELAVRYAASRGYLWEEIISPSKFSPLVKVRQEAIYEVRKAYPTYSWPQIGKIFQRDHSTCIHAVRRVEEQRRAA